ncbi:predicted protein [Naegleria gruberi]|uniref:Predicted protein n=1 Tax=Naegleria gruberi TaxID=5762 RepID=D2W2Z7_NAEGR|nr:uncharacterized protein NAEGRDRAFT_75767 [Naegleria gruberi]EFC36526.1 predicted protein [Naegleria gruberi]|eukprot:XP_002669270.1 predicted protein [Naegleria gruberi strain NEG-M]
MSVNNKNNNTFQPTTTQQLPPNHPYNIMINNSFNNTLPTASSNNNNGGGNKSSPTISSNITPTIPMMNQHPFFSQIASNTLQPSTTSPQTNATATSSNTSLPPNQNALMGNNSLYEQLLLQEQLFSAFLHNYYQYQRMMMEQQNLHSLYSQQVNAQQMVSNSPSSIGTPQHHSQPPLLINSNSPSASNANPAGLFNPNIQPTGMTSVAIPEPLYELYIRPILHNLQQNLYKTNNDQMGLVTDSNFQQDNSAVFFDEQHLPPVDTMLLYSNHQLDADKEEEKNSPQPHKAYDPKKNKKGLKKKRKYIKSGLFKKDRDGNFLISINDRARLAQYGLSMPKPEGDEGEVILNGEDEHQFYEEEEEEDDQTQTNDTVNNTLPQDHNLMNSINIHDLLGGHDAHGLLEPQHEPINTKFSEEQSQMGFEWYFAEQFQNFPSANDFFQQEEEKSQMRIFVWAQWQLLHDSEKQHYIELALASQREMLQQVVASSSYSGGTPSDSRNLLSESESIIGVDETNINNKVEQPLVPPKDKEESEDEQINEESLKELDKNVTANRVKKPLSGYNSFVKSVFPSFQEMYPNIDKKQITKLIGQKWKAMPEDEKQPYIEMARQAQPIVKKPLNAYNIYCKEKYSIFKEENPDLAPNEVSRMVASSWKKAKKEEKQKYYDLAEKWKQESEEMISTAVEKQTKQKTKKRKI